jgi:uncharacterized membrane protein
MSQYSHGYEPQSQTGETRPAYAPEPIDLQQFEQQHYTNPQSSSFQQQVPPQQMGPQPVHHYTYVQHVFVYPQSGPDSLSKIAAALSYLGFWFSALLLLLFVRNNRFVRFHAFQSLLLFGGMNILYIVFFLSAWFWYRTDHMWHYGWPLLLIGLLGFILLNIIAGISWLVGTGGAMIGKYVKLPFVGDLAEKFAGGSSAGQPRE